MKTHSLNVVSFIMYFVCAVATACMIAPFFIDIKYSHSEKFVTGFIVFALGFIASKFRSMVSNSAKAQQIMKRTFIWLFAVYVFIIIDFTLISESFGRNISSIFLLDNAAAREYISDNTNFIPFETVRLFLNASNLAPYRVLENILGNFLAFMPFALFVPNIFKGVNSILKFFVFVSVTVILIEALQLVFLSGSADIDDFILNVSGAMTAYVLFNLNLLKGHIKNFVLGEQNENKG